MRGRSPLFPPLEGASPLISVSGRKNAPHIAERAKSLSLRPAKMHNFAFRGHLYDQGRKRPNCNQQQAFRPCFSIISPFSRKCRGAFPHITVKKASTFKLCHLFFISLLWVWAGRTPAHLIGAGRSERKTCFCVRCKVCCYPGRQTGRCNPVTPTISGECRHVKVQNRAFANYTGGATPTFPDQQSL